MQDETPQDHRDYDNRERYLQEWLTALSAKQGEKKLAWESIRA